MAPVIRTLAQADWAEQIVLSSGQHPHMLSPIFDFFGITVDENLSVMRGGQSLASLSARALEAFDGAINRYRPDCIIVQGDTTTVAMASLAAFYHHVPVAHVEAGLRTSDLRNPFPEELNRIIAGRVAGLHFAPTETAASALRAEGVAEDRIMVTGNTVIDALNLASAKNPPLPFVLPEDRKIILVTLHRRENLGKRIEDICGAIGDVLEKLPDTYVVWPVHPNPKVKQQVEMHFADHRRVRLCPPLPYPAFVTMMNRAHLIMTDSGGVQEEAPALGKPVLVLRETTERPEAIREGVVELVGCGRTRIAKRAITLLTDDKAYQAMARGVSPYGDGAAAMRIVERIRTYLT